MRQVRVVVLSTLMMLLFGLLSQAQVADDASARGARPAFSGGGTTNYVPLWLSKTKLGNSTLFQSTAGDIGVGTTSPAATLDVDGSINAATSFNLGGGVFALGNGSKGNAFDGFAGNSRRRAPITLQRGPVRWRRTLRDLPTMPTGKRRSSTTAVATTTPLSGRTRSSTSPPVSKTRPSAWTRSKPAMAAS